MLELQLCTNVLSSELVHEMHEMSNHNRQERLQEFCWLKKKKYQGVKEFHMLARIGCYCNIMVFSPFQVKVTYYHPLNQWLIGATNGNHGQTVMHLQCSETINHS